jgi:hypothetical protein
MTGATLAALMLTGMVPILEAQQGAGRGNNKKDRHDEHVATSNADTNVAVHVVWSARDVEMIRTYYEPQYRGRRLPPGLAKKYARTGQLPPGWQKKMEPMPVVVERKLPPLPAGHHRGVIDGVAVIYNSRGVIIDVAMLL